MHYLDALLLLVLVKGLEEHLIRALIVREPVPNPGHVLDGIPLLGVRKGGCRDGSRGGNRCDSRGVVVILGNFNIISHGQESLKA